MKRCPVVKDVLNTFQNHEIVIVTFLTETTLIGLLSFASIAVQQQEALGRKVMFRMIAPTIATISTLFVENIN